MTELKWNLTIYDDNHAIEGRDGDMWQLEYAHLLIYIECDDILYQTVLNCGMLRLMHVRKVQCYSLAVGSEG